jgi:hypothetical protein
VRRIAIGPLVLLVVVGLLAGEVGASAPAANVDPPRVTLIGDSVAKGLEWNEQALAILRKGIDLQLQVDVCRRLVGESCPYEGEQAPTLVDLAAALGPRLGQTVVVIAGHNDFAQTFAQAVEASVTALVAAGVRRIFWATLRAARRPYLAMNDDLRAAAGRHPQLTLVDWNRFSRSHRDWFQNDGIHLYPAGGLALASLLRTALADPASIEADTPPAISTGRLPVGRQGKLYVAQLGAKGGAEPYSWSLASGPLPKGLGLEPGGRISGRARQPGRTSIIVRVTDANGLTTTLHLGLLILPSSR